MKDLVLFDSVVLEITITSQSKQVSLEDLRNPETIHRNHHTFFNEYLNYLEMNCSRRCSTAS